MKSQSDLPVHKYTNPRAATRLFSLRYHTTIEIEIGEFDLGFTELRWCSESFLIAGRTVDLFEACPTVATSWVR